MIASLSAALAAGDAAAQGGAGGAEQIVFWIVAPLALIGAVGMLFSRGAVHSALWLVVTMLCLGVLYIVQEAEFLGFAQIIVYTGAIMMLFLFVLMLTGRDAGDSVIEVLRGQRIAAGLLGLGLVGLLVAVLMHAFEAATPVGLGAAFADRGAVGSLAAAIFTDYLFPFELTSALLITAAVGAMVLAHVERRRHQRSSQRATVLHRMRSDRMSPLPGPGVHATSSSNASPAMLPDGSIAPGSVSPLVELAVTESVALKYREGRASGDLLVPISGPEHPWRPRRARALPGAETALPGEDTAEGGVTPAVVTSGTDEGSEK